jgi:hypothetical protein
MTPWSCLPRAVKTPFIRQPRNSVAFSPAMQPTQPPKQCIPRKIYLHLTRPYQLQTMFSAAYERITVKHEFSISQSVVADFRALSCNPSACPEEKHVMFQGCRCGPVFASTSEMSDARGLLLGYAEPVAYRVPQACSFFACYPALY